MADPPSRAPFKIRGLSEYEVANLRPPLEEARDWHRWEPRARPCPWCGHPFTPKRRDQGYCSTRCGSKAHDRETQRARWVYRSLYWWLKTKKPEHLVMVLRMVRGWAKGDEVEGRGPPLEPDYTTAWTGRQPRKGSRGEFHEVDLAIRGLEILERQSLEDEGE